MHLHLLSGLLSVRLSSTFKKPVGLLTPTLRESGVDADSAVQHRILAIMLVWVGLFVRVRVHLLRGSRGPSTVTLMARWYVATWGGPVNTVMVRVKLFPAAQQPNRVHECYLFFFVNDRLEWSAKLIFSLLTTILRLFNLKSSPAFVQLLQPLNSN